MRRAKAFRAFALFISTAPLFLFSGCSKGGDDGTEIIDGEGKIENMNPHSFDALMKGIGME